MMRKSWLPPHVSEYRDRHGKARYRWRKTGFPTHHFTADPGTTGFLAQLAACNAALPLRATQASPYAAGSFDDLADRYYRANAFTQCAANCHA
jgi:hypothetical protein